METKKASRPITQRKNPARGSSRKWNGRSGRPMDTIAVVAVCSWTAMTPAMTAARAAAALTAKETVIVRFRNFAQQGAITTGESIIKIDAIAISKGAIMPAFYQHTPHHIRMAQPSTDGIISIIWRNGFQATAEFLTGALQVKSKPH